MNDSSKPKSKPECFIIMPISDPDGYSTGHFKHVFDDIFAPACVKAGFEPIRADQVRQTNLIHLDVLQKLVESPMALCDLSSRNPNVLFELGLRQAFDKPVALVREIGTADIFDIAPLRYTEYRREQIYHEVLEDQEAIATSITATIEAFKNGQGINSIVKLLSLTKPATLVEVQEADKDPVLHIIRAELSELRSEIRSALQDSQPRVASGLSLARPRISDELVERTRKQIIYLFDSIDSALEEIRKGISKAKINQEMPKELPELFGNTKSLLNAVAILPTEDATRK